MNEIKIHDRIAALDAQRRELAVKRIALEVRIRRLTQADERAVAEITRLNELLREQAYCEANARHPLPLSGDGEIAE